MERLSSGFTRGVVHGGRVTAVFPAGGDSKPPTQVMS